jgi:hypothetical protein
MGDKKGHHIFEIGELVLPHPIMCYFWKDIDENDMGIVVEKINPTHPTKDFRKVKVFWQIKGVEDVYYSHLFYHLHNEEALKELREKWYKYKNISVESSYGYFEMDKLFNVAYPRRKPKILK